MRATPTHPGLSRTCFSLSSCELTVEISYNNQVPFFFFNSSYAKGDLDISYITSRIAGTSASFNRKDELLVLSCLRTVRGILASWAATHSPEM